MMRPKLIGMLYGVEVCVLPAGYRVLPGDAILGAGLASLVRLRQFVHDHRVCNAEIQRVLVTPTQANEITKDAGHAVDSDGQPPDITLHKRELQVLTYLAERGGSALCDHDYCPMTVCMALQDKALVWLSGGTDRDPSASLTPTGRGLAAVVLKVLAERAEQPSAEVVEISSFMRRRR